MKVMVLVKATANSEAGVMPTEQLLREMGQFNEELVKAGVMLAADGLQPTSRGARVRFSGGSRTVMRGPFSLKDGIVAGFWIWEVNAPLPHCPRRRLGFRPVPRGNGCARSPRQRSGETLAVRRASGCNPARHSQETAAP
jgi:hypothetical protein